MRRIAKGQTVSILVIPEVLELMKRQIARAGPGLRRTPLGAAASSEHQQQLLDIAAWLTLNSMRTERVMYDQLCAQNLATLWRQNAWNQLIEGHEHFKQRPECSQAVFCCILYAV